MNPGAFSKVFRGRFFAVHLRKNALGKSCERTKILLPQLIMKKNYEKEIIDQLTCLEVHMQNCHIEFKKRGSSVIDSVLTIPWGIQG